MDLFIVCATSAISRGRKSQQQLVDICIWGRVRGGGSEGVDQKGQQSGRPA